VVAVREVAELAAGQGLPHGPVVAGVGDHQVTAGPQDAGELGQDRTQVQDMGQREGADDDIDVLVRHGQLV